MHETMLSIGADVLVLRTECSDHCSCTLTLQKPEDRSQSSGSRKLRAFCNTLLMTFFTTSSGLDVGVGLSMTAALHAKVALDPTPALSSGTFATAFLVLACFAELQAVFVRNVQ